MEVKHISGLDIIEMLNERLLDENENTDDICIQGPLEFENQYIVKNKEYVLEFSAEYNNWGTIQTIGANRIYINSDGCVRVFLNEPLDSDESSTFVRDKIQNFLTTYVPNQQSNDAKFSDLLMEARDRLGVIRLSEEHTESMDSVLLLLKKARAIMYAFVIMVLSGCSTDGYTERTNAEPTVDTLVLVKIGITAGKHQKIMLHYENVRTGEMSTREVMEYENNIGDTIIVRGVE